MSGFGTGGGFGQPSGGFGSGGFGQQQQQQQTQQAPSMGFGQPPAQQPMGFGQPAPPMGAAAAFGGQPAHQQQPQPSAGFGTSGFLGAATTPAPAAGGSMGFGGTGGSFGGGGFGGQSAATPAMATFGSSSGGFGTGTATAGGGGFGASSMATTAGVSGTGFGQSQQQGFGQSSAGFGQTQTQQQPQQQQPQQPQSGFGQSTSGFGQSTPGFGQQQQQPQSQQSTGFGSSSSSGGGAFGSTPNTSMGGGAATAPAAPSAPMVFGASATVAASNAPSSSSIVATAGFAPAAAAPSSSGFGSSAAPSSGFGSGSNAPPSSSSSGFGTGGLSATAKPFAPTSGGFGASSTPTTGGFGGSGDSTTAGGGFGVSSTGAPGSAPFGQSKTTAGAGTFGGGGAPSSGFGTSPTKTAGGGGDAFGSSSGFGKSSTAFGASGGGSAGFGSSASSKPTTPFGSSSTTPGDTASSSPFGQRIPRKDKSGMDQQKDGAEASMTSEARTPLASDEKLNALKAKILEKRKKLQQLKQSEKGEVTDDRKEKESHATARINSNNNNANNSNNSANAELAAKNALRFSTSNSDRDQTLNKLLPTDLKARSQQTEAQQQSNNNNNANIGSGEDGAWSTPADTEDEDDNDELETRNLSNAKSLVGICRSMCPDEELLRREKEGDIQLLEITDPGGLHPKEWTLRDTAVKRFRRSAADFKLDIPELVRPPEVLERVCGYLEEWVMERDRQGPDKRWMQSQQPHDTPPPLDVYQFIWDRTRMIRKDFILQNYIGTGGNCDARAVRCHERIARWHAMCEHQLSHIPDFVAHQSQQNIAELGQTMKTLNNYYDDALGRSLKEEAIPNEGGAATSSNQGCGSDVIMGKSPVDFDGTALANSAQDADVSKRIIGRNGINSSSRGTAEPEMRGLYILLTLNNEGGMEVLKYSGRLCVQRPAIFYSKPVQLALSIFQAKKDHNYARFFNLLRSPSTPYLFACIMFKYVEDMRKYALTIMSKTYGAKHKTTGQAFYDSYPLKNLVKLLCYEDEEEALTACRHYGITVEGDQVMWRHSKFREPRDPEKGHIIPLKPRKMIRTVESKLQGATRLSVCRGGVSGEGATLSPSSSGSNAAEVAMERQKAQEAAEKARKEAMFKEALRQARAKEQAEKLEKERRRQEQMAAEKRARAEAARRAEMERLEKERIQRERALAEQKRKEEEARRLAEAKAAAERAEKERLEREEREREEACRRAEEERKEQERQRILKKQREEEARRLAEIKAAKERAEKKRREEEERQRLAELRRKAEEERIRKAKEEEERRIEMMWQQKIEKARKVLAWRLWRKQMHKHESQQLSLRCLASLDPTSTNYPPPLPQPAHALHNDLAITRGDTIESDLENQIYRLATASKEPINLAKMVADCIMKSSNDDKTIFYPPSLEPNNNVILFKLAVLLPKESSAVDVSTLRMWVDSHLWLGSVSSHIFRRRSQQYEVRAVAVIGNEDQAQCKDCNGALLLLPSASRISSQIVEFPEEEVEELLINDVSRMVFVLDDGCNSDMNHLTETVLDNLVGKVQIPTQQRQGVACPNVSQFENAFEKCCNSIVMSHFERDSQEIQVNSHANPSLGRVSLANVGFLCLQRLIQNMDSEGVFSHGSTLEGSIFTSCEKTLELMVQELSQASDEVYQSLQKWPPKEFQDRETNSVPMYFEGQYDLPPDWYLPLTDLKRKVFEIFHELLEKDSFDTFVERFSQKLSPYKRQSLLNMTDDNEISRCFTNVVSLFVDGVLSVDESKEAIVYLPIERVSQIIERVSTFEAPELQEPVLVEIPSYLCPKSIIEEEKENSRIENINEAPNQIDKNTNKRKPPEIIEPETPDRVKRIRSSTLQTEEQRKSKEFTSFLEALLS